MALFRKLLFPFSFLYGLIIYLRNVLYDVGILKSHSFDIPVISVGNIAVGGTGKTPHVEYLVRLLKDQYKIAVLSRGYKRTTSDYFLAENISDASEIGDEPCQIKQKFPDIQVAVCEDRVEGVKNLLKAFPDLDVVLLDDAYQHRQIRPNLSILLIDYNSLFKNRMLLPAGDLREPFTAKKRADILIVTKTPEIISDKEKENILKKLKPRKDQKVFYTYIEYGLLTNCFENTDHIPTLDENLSIMLFCGVANPQPLRNYLEANTKEVLMKRYGDHHKFTHGDLSSIADVYREIVNLEKCIITTEKDAMRLQTTDISDTLNKFQIFYLPIKVKLHEKAEEFESLIKGYLKEKGND